MVLEFQKSACAKFKKSAALSLAAVHPWVSPFTSCGLCFLLTCLMIRPGCQGLSVHRGTAIAPLPITHPVSRIREPAPVPADGGRVQQVHCRKEDKSTSDPWAPPFPSPLGPGWPGHTGLLSAPNTPAPVSGSFLTSLAFKAQFKFLLFPEAFLHHHKI